MLVVVLLLFSSIFFLFVLYLLNCITVDYNLFVLVNLHTQSFVLDLSLTLNNLTTKKPFLTIISLLIVYQRDSAIQCVMLLNDMVYIYIYINSAAADQTAHTFMKMRSLFWSDTVYT